MADYNRNRSNNASDDNWNQNQDRNSRNADHNQSNYSNSNYNQESDWRNMDRNRQSNYGSTSYGNTSAGTHDNTGAYGGGGYGMYPDDYNKTSNRNMGGDYNTNYGNNYRRQDWGRANVDSGMGYNDYDRNYNDYDRGSRNRNGYSEGYGYAGDYNTGYYGTGNMNYNRNSDDWQRTSDQRNRHENNYRNTIMGRNDRDWWDRTKDEVSSWFGDDDAERRRRRDEMKASGGYRGRGPKDYHRSEDRIREDVCDRLTDDDMLDATNIQVQIQGDNVILSGTVHNREQKRRAEDVAESISGVRDVENRIRVDHNDNSSSSYSERSDQSGTTNEVIRSERKGKNNP